MCSYMCRFYIGVVSAEVLHRRQAPRKEFGLQDGALGTSVSGCGGDGYPHRGDVTVPAAHHPVTVEAMFAGLPVLCEKPVEPTGAEGLSLAAAAEVSGQLLIISQSRRSLQRLTQLKVLTRTRRF